MNSSSFDKPPTSSEDNEEPFISKEAFDQFYLITELILNPIICIFGLVGNSVGVQLLRRDSRTQGLGFRFYMLVLLITEIVLLCLGLIRPVPEIIKLHNSQFANYFERHMTFTFVFAETCIAFIASCVLILLSAERLFSLVRPFTFKEYFIVKHPVTVFCICVFLSFAYTIPVAFCLEVTTELSAENATIYILATRPNMEGFMNNYLLFEAVVLHCLCPVALLAFNTALLIAYRRYQKTNTSTFSSKCARDTQASKLTVIVVTIIVLFLLLSIPDFIGLSLGFTNEEYSFKGKYRQVFRFLIALSNCFEYVNASCTATIYIFASSALRRNFCRCCR